MSWTWKWLDLAIVIAAVILGLAVWFIPNMMNSKEMKDLVAVSNERKAVHEAYLKRQAEIKKEQEELGLVFLSPTSPADDKATGDKKVAPKRDK
jgi:hypothetical protein